MEKPQKIVTLVYAYSVCLGAIIASLICLPILIGAIIDVSDPLPPYYYDGPKLTSFETYKTDILKSLVNSGEQPLYIPDDQTLKAMYEDTKANAIKEARRSASTSLVSSILPLIICIALFIGHWRWIRRIAKTEG